MLALTFGLTKGEISVCVCVCVNHLVFEERCVVVMHSDSQGKEGTCMMVD